MRRVIALLKRDGLLWEAAALAWLVALPFVLTAHGDLAAAGHVLGRDFVNVWTAGRLADQGRIADIFDPDRFTVAQHALLDPARSFHFWSYPPPALFLAAPFGALPYIPALILWSALGLLALIPAVRAVFRDTPTRWLAILTPAAAIDLALGQNGAFSAAVLVGGVALMAQPNTPLMPANARTQIERQKGARKPKDWLAGALFGLLVLKPQLAMLLPVALIAEWRWRTALATAITAAAILALSIPAFGLEAWRGWFGPALATQAAELTQGVGPYQWLMPSVFMSGRLLGLPLTLDALAQAATALFAAVLVWRTFRTGADAGLKAAALFAVAPLATPQVFAYDLIPSALAALILWRRDDTALGRGLALLLWSTPLLMLASQAIHVVFAPLVIGGAAFRLSQLAGLPSRASSASAAGEAASNT